MFINSGIYETVVVLGTYNRSHLLARSLKLYERENILLIIMDDDSNDDTYAICESSSCPVFYFKSPPKNGIWRDSASILNMGICYAIHKFGAKYIFITHPEIMPGSTTVRDCKALATDHTTWINAKGYYLSIDNQKMIDSIDWELDPLNIRQLPGFYNATPTPFQNNDYTPEAIDRTAIWGSWIFGGGSVEMWNYFGGLTEFEIWGSVDVDLLNRRVKLGMNTVTPENETAIVIHQNHDDPAINIITPRDMEKCMAALPDYDIENPQKPHLLHAQRFFKSEAICCNLDF